MKSLTEEKSLPCAREPSKLWKKKKKKKRPAQSQVSKALITEVRLGGVSDVNFLVGQTLREGSACQWAQQCDEGSLNCH